MTINLTSNANEKGTYIVSVTFTDEDDASVTPNSGLTWTLTDLDGNVINSREDVAITEASTIDIVLTDSDLQVVTGHDRRIVTVEGTYDSSLGTNLPIKEEIRFAITDLVNVT